LFYDGECGFCNQSVQFVLKHERHHDILFSPLQSEFSQAFFSELGQEQIDYSTLYFWSNEQLHDRSSAVFQLLKHMRYPIKLFRVFGFIPHFIRDYCYNIIARNRKRIAGSFCVIPTTEQRKRFLS
jgi:predicted DCC family thiol-disulfide oxidoreductase YuxK